MFHWKSLFRRKKIPEDLFSSELRRSLSLYHVVFLGVAIIMGGGIYSVTGTVVRYTAGPAAVLSYLIAAVVAALSAVCYAEFAARVPRAGSAYIYSYVTVGELPAFVVGWNFVLEMVIGASGVAISGAAYALELLRPNALQSATETLLNQTNGSVSVSDFVPSTSSWTSVLVACGIVLLCALFSLVSAQCSASAAMGLIGVSTTALVFFIAYGLQFADFDLWKPFDVPGEGFMPFGFAGVMYGSSSLFFCYAGFDVICTLTEEVKDPQRNVPLAILIVLSIVTVLFVFATMTLVLMVPYDIVNANNAFAFVFVQIGEPWAKYVMITGALCACLAGVTSCALSVARLLYAMSKDGMIFSWIGTINQSTQVPINATVLGASVMIFFISLFDLQTLVEFLAIGTLVAYTTVTLSVLILRYRPIETSERVDTDSERDVDVRTPLILRSEERRNSKELTTFRDLSVHDGSAPSYEPWLIATGRRLPNCLFANHEPFECAKLYMTLVITCSFKIVLSIRFFHEFDNSLYKLGLIIVITLSLLMAAVFCKLLSGITQVYEELTFKVPLAPWLPLVSIFANLLLIVYLNPYTWIRFAIWMALGTALYIGYSYSHSEVGRNSGIEHIVHTFEK